MPSEASPPPAASFASTRAELLARPAHRGPGLRRSLSDLADRWLGTLLADGLCSAGLAVDAPPVESPPVESPPVEFPLGLTEPPVTADGVALVAVGGYGRRELSPGSDLDVVLLHTGSRRMDEVAEKIWYPVWDSGVHLDHAVRTVEEAREVAASDLPAQVGLLSARHIAGDAELTAQLQTGVLADWRAGARLRELKDLCDERAARHGELAYLLEGDLKEARGGIRDVQVLYAVAASWVADVPHTRLPEAHTVLLDVRDSLHLVTGRGVDRLFLQEQDAVARDLALLDADALLRRVSEAARSVTYSADVTWRRALQVVESRRRSSLWRRASAGRSGADRRGRRAEPERSPLAEGVVVQDGEVVLARDAHPEHDPVLVLRVAAAAAQAGLPVAPHAMERLAAESAPMPVPWPDGARREFVALLGSGRALVGVWEGLDWHGIISRLLPDWERVRCRPQRNALHQFTVDRHLIEAVVMASARTRRVRRPDLLLLGALLHDIGKGWPGDHSRTGEVIAADLSRRWGLPADDSDVLVTLVRHHLLLPAVATSRDLDDPATVMTVARAVRTADVLELLDALTESDALATGPAAWNSWRAGLVADLVSRVRAGLDGQPAPGPAPLPPERRALAEAGRFTVTLKPGEKEDGEGAEVTVVAPDRLGLLSVVAGVLSLHRVQVRAAIAESVGDMAVQAWTVAPLFGELPDEAALRRDIDRAIAGTLAVSERLAQRDEERRTRPGLPVPPPRVSLVPGASASATVIEVRAHDVPGLLHRIGRALAEAGADIRQARVSTLGAEVVDAFYVVDPDGRPLPDEMAQRVVRAVRAALG